MWVACSNRETIKLAARLGIGALTFAFVDPAEAKQWVDDYYRIFKEECVPIGHAVNRQHRMVTGFSVHPRPRGSAAAAALDGFRFFGYALGHHYIFGEHKPGRTDIWKNFEAATRSHAAQSRAAAASARRTRCARICANSPSPASTRSRSSSRAGAISHEHICEALELFARDIMPEFKEHAASRRKKPKNSRRLSSRPSRAKKDRKRRDDEIPNVIALGRKVAEEGTGTERQKENAKLWADAAKVTLSDPTRHGGKTPAAS